MKKIEAKPMGGETWNIFINDEFIQQVENSGSGYDAAEDYLIQEGLNPDKYEIIE